MGGRYWRQHPKKELEELLQVFHQAGWRIAERWIHLTPSGANYARNALMWLMRQECSLEEE